MDKVAPANDPLAGLIDIALPPAVSLWPETWASRITLVVLVIALALLAWWSIRRWLANRYRREALADLDSIERSAAGLDALSLLVRRTALSVFPRDTVAPLSGAAWLAFLDRSYGGSEFSQGPGRILALAPYDGRAPPAADIDALAALVRQWIRGHHV
jgi:Ca-activated chloride channel family protein